MSDAPSTTRRATSTHPAALPLAWTWADVVDLHIAERGSLAELARTLQDVAPDSAGLSPDTMTVERGLRRLRKRGNREGNRYGRLVLRCLGLPTSMSTWVREMGQYHSRCSDLPIPLKRDQLHRWDCPPLTESLAAIWVHVGLASIAHQLRDAPLRDQRLKLATHLKPRVATAAQLEVLLLSALVASDADDLQAARLHLGEARDLLLASPPPGDDRAGYLARLHDQEAYLLTHAHRDDPERLHRALALYDAIPSVTPFAAFRREHGRAWCLWRLDRRDEALAAAVIACQQAGDGGFVRFRVLTLGLRAHILGPGPEALAALARAEAMADRLGDERLLSRMRRFQRRLSR